MVGRVEAALYACLWDVLFRPCKHAASFGGHVLLLNNLCYPIDLVAIQLDDDLLTTFSTRTFKVARSVVEVLLDSRELLPVYISQLTAEKLVI